MALPQPGQDAWCVPAHVRHKPEQTLLYQLVAQYWPEFQTQLSETGRFLPRHVTREFEDYLACGRLENGFLRVRCESCSHEHLVAFSCKRRGFCGAAFGPAVAPDAWWRRLHFWWIMYCRTDLFANGY